MEINELRDKIHNAHGERDWHQFHEPKEVAIDISCEAAELLELFQWQIMDDAEEVKKNEKLMDKIKHELGDVIASSLQMAGVLKLDVEELVLKSLDNMCKKYPVEKYKGVRPKKY